MKNILNDRSKYLKQRILKRKLFSFSFAERVMALYPYQAQNEDELSFEKGDVITVLAKEEEAWWRGELNGVSGVFPSNYVSSMCE